ncbi:uncharacterized protein METZ01_LOCUS249378, partial [marine metagenome]
MNKVSGILLIILLVNFACNRVENTDQLPVGDVLTPKTGIYVTSVAETQSLPSISVNAETPVSVTQIPIPPLVISTSTPVDFISVSSH